MIKLAAIAFVIIVSVQALVGAEVKEIGTSLVNDRIAQIEEASNW